jgi:hypothetical protein
MYLIYLDESGNSGKNLADTQQPVFVLGALIVPEEKWLAVEAELEQLVSPIRSIVGEKFEIHAHELARGEGSFKHMSLTDRLTLRDALLHSARKHGLRFVYRSIVKKRYAQWLSKVYGGNVFILREQGKLSLGILIFDENREVYMDIERTVRLLRADPGNLRLNRIIEKGFFVDSRKSLLIQLSDVCTYHARKLEERKLGLKPRIIDDSGLELLAPLVYRAQESMPDVLKWLSEQKDSGEESQRDSGR